MNTWRRKILGTQLNIGINHVEVNVFIFVLFVCSRPNWRVWIRMRVCSSECARTVCLCSVLTSEMRWDTGEDTLWWCGSESSCSFMSCNEVPSAAEAQIELLPVASHHNTMDHNNFKQIVWDFQTWSELPSTEMNQILFCNLTNVTTNPVLSNHEMQWTLHICTRCQSQ